MAKIEIKAGSQTYHGKTQREAHAAALAHLAALFPDDGEYWAPIVVQAGPQVLVGHKTESGDWGYVVYRGGQNCGGTYGQWNRRACEFAMRRHAAQYTYDSADGGAASLAFIHRDDSEGRKEHERWIAFQAAHARPVHAA
jgi:hypothetical protein